jgi:hypothetical protein
MKFSHITHHRLFNQQIFKPTFESADEVVKWMGAMQAQDYLASLWAIALRTKNQTEADVESAIADKSIIRSWPMRGTLHFVTPQDLRWMLKYLTARPIARAATQHKQEGLTSKDFAKSRKVVEKIMTGHQLTRDEIYNALEINKVSCEGQRGMHIIVQLAQEGLICIAARRGKQHTFALLDEWIPSSTMINKEEALYQLAKRYFTSHGPATIHDFTWWTGLSPEDARMACRSVESSVEKYEIENTTYWMSKGSEAKESKGLHLLPAFDEFLVAYKDRSAAAETKDARLIQMTANGIFNPMIVCKGKVVGQWKRELSKSKVNIEIKNFKPDKTVAAAIAKEAKRYARFLGLESTIK